MSQEILAPKIRKFLESTNKPNPMSSTEVAAVDRLKHILLNQFGPEREPRNENEIKLYPSEAGKCERATLYKALGIPGEPFSADTKYKFAVGDLIELSLVFLLGNIPDVLLTDNNKKMEIQIGRERHRGASDGIVSVGAGPRRNLEVKSTSAVSFRITKQKGVDDAFGYLTQACVYTRHMLSKGLIDEPETIFLFVDRDTLHIHEELVRFEDWYLAEEADAKFDRILDAIKAKRVPKRPYELERGKLGLQCKYCSHKYTCWVKPHQAVTFKDGQEPVYRAKPTQYLQITVERGKPNWVLIGAE